MLKLHVDAVFYRAFEFFSSFCKSKFLIRKQTRYMWSKAFFYERKRYDLTAKHFLLLLFVSSVFSVCDNPSSPTLNVPANNYIIPVGTTTLNYRWANPTDFGDCSCNSITVRVRLGGGSSVQVASPGCGSTSTTAGFHYNT